MLSEAGQGGLGTAPSKVWGKGKGSAQEGQGQEGGWEPPLPKLLDLSSNPHSLNNSC